jgi:hypothetical protein
MEKDWLQRVAKPAWHRMADKMPYQFHDPRLAIGYIPFADIVGDINKEELISHISKYAK